MTVGNPEPTPETLVKSLLDVTVESWRFVRLFNRLLTKLDAGEQGRYRSHFRWFERKLEKSLLDAGMRIENVEGHQFDPGMAATPLESEEDAFALEIKSPGSARSSLRRWRPRLSLGRARSPTKLILASCSKTSFVFHRRAYSGKERKSLVFSSVCRAGHCGGWLVLERNSAFKGKRSGCSMISCDRSTSRSGQ